jgi:hypothetical protein
VQCSKKMYSITSSASESRLSEILMPSDLATLTLISSNLSDCTTGSSAGLAPLRILPAVDTSPAVRRREIGAVAHQAAGSHKGAAGFSPRGPRHHAVTPSRATLDTAN